ncbi:MAG: type IA DNA topoisomerase [Butyrivibrio sp.]|nr:type IA DNA topoisomerase [Butyrivibrio sp.]
MSKQLYIAEKPSVAKAFAAALDGHFTSRDGYMESDTSIVTWCVGHLVTMSYPEVYDPKFKRWSFDTLPFLPEKYLYEVIDTARRQYAIVREQLLRDDVDTIYVCTDSGREGEYIYRLVEQQAGVRRKNKARRRVWIDSQTVEEILRGIREAKDESAYDNLSAAAFLRAKEDYLMGINFSRALTLRYGDTLQQALGTERRQVIAVGRVMTCVLGMVVRREREIRDFVKTPYYRVTGSLEGVSAEWRVTPDSVYEGTPLLYNERGFKERETAQALIDRLGPSPVPMVVVKCEKKKEQKRAPLLYNLAELQNDCARRFKIDPNQTLQIAQELYEKKLTTYPRTDARVLSSAIAKEIHKNIEGLTGLEELGIYARSILQHGAEKGIGRTRYVDDKAITDHYAIIPTGQGMSALKSLKPLSRSVYELIVRRFLAIFYPPAVYRRIALEAATEERENHAEHFFSSFRMLESMGYLHVTGIPERQKQGKSQSDENESGGDAVEEEITDESLFERIGRLRKGSRVELNEPQIREGETKPPRRYSTGSMILAMENAGQFIEDEELRAQIKGSGIGTSATRAGILEKLFRNQYLALNRKTQIITPTETGELIYEVVALSMKPMLDPALTASWEKGLSGVEQGTISEEAYMDKLTDFIIRRVSGVREGDYRDYLRERLRYVRSQHIGDAPAKKTSQPPRKGGTKRRKTS